METSDDMRGAIEQFEGCRLTAYRDAVGVLTIGYGHTGDDVTDGLTITQDDADQLLADDLGTFEDVVTDAASKDTSQQQFDALVSFSYNLGEGALRSSTLLRKHNAGDYAGAAREFGRWDHAGGRVLAGLTRRRSFEAQVYSRGDYTIA